MSIGGSDEHASSLVREALDKDVNLIEFLTSILEGTVKGGDKVGGEDMSICKVHTVEIMHCLEADGLYGADVRAQLDGKYSKRRRSNVAVIIVRIDFISSFLFYCLLLNHSFPTNPNRITNCFQLILSIYNLQLHCSCVAF